MTPAWLINRLKLMSLGEVFYRIRQSVSSSVEKVGLKYGWEPQTNSPIKTRPLIIDEQLMRTFPSSEPASAAGGLLKGKLSLFDYVDLDVSWPINWHRDPLTGVASPADQFGKTIDYRDDQQVGDIKVLWEMGRQQFIVPVAIEYYLNREQAQLDVLAGVLNSWIEQNPYGYGVHWCSSLEVAIRGLSWSMAHQFLLAAGLPKGLFSLDIDPPLLEKQIFQHAAFIRGHLSLYSSANNHLIGELTGLHVLCSLFDFGDQSEQWKDFAWQSLLEESNRQVYEDGVNKEQAIYYHCWVLEYFLINYLIAGHSGQNIPEAYVGQLSKMAQFVSDLSPMAMEPPQIGDADDGVAIQFSSMSCSFHKDLIEAVNALAGVLPAGDCGTKAFCYRLFYKAGSSKTPAPVEETCYPAAYTEGGYAVLGKPEFHVVFDSGALGYPSIAAHGHADMLNTCLAIDGEWWLVDPGTFSYHSDQGWRNYFRGSLGHNVLVVNQKNQSEIGGPFMWVKHATAHFEDTHSTAGVQEASGWHDGYAGEGVLRVHRALQVDPLSEQLIITDDVECSGEIDVSIYYHFSPDIYCVEQHGSSILLARTGSHTQIKMELPEQLSVKSYNGDKEMQLGWYSSGLGRKEPTLTFRASTNITTATTFTTRLSVVRGR